MCGLGTWELLIVLVIVVLLFGAARLPQLGKALGETVRNFKKGQAAPDAVQATKKKDPIPAHDVAQLVQGDDDDDDNDDKAPADKAGY